MEFITDISVIIDEAGFSNPGNLKKILQAYSPERISRCYKVSGTFEELENLSIQLLALQENFSSASYGQSRHQDENAAVRSVDVSGLFMDYIEQKCGKDLSQICGNSFILETWPEFRKEHSEPRGTVQVTFKPLHGSVKPVSADFVRQRFVTFYQRTASDLQVTSIPMGVHDIRDFQKRFPLIIFKPQHNKGELQVTGSFLHIAKLKDFLFQSTPSPVSKDPLVMADRRALGHSPSHSKDPEEETCPICMEQIAIKERKTLSCKHSFCRECVKKAFQYKPVCPTCGCVHGILTGNQPKGGKMNVTKNDSSLPGYEKYGTIIIHYYIPSGKQKEEHPNPGQPYEGASRKAYLPDSPEGRRVLKLLQQAFDQRLIFTVGRSTTSGRNNMVTWNDIHHKTSTHGGPTQYGYPDPDYLSRVRDELKVKGIE